MGMFSSNPRPVVDCSKSPSRTKQSFKDECDINVIMRRYKKTGLVTHLARGVPRFADVSEIGVYRDAIEAVRAGEEHFMTLPAKLREAFENDPATYVEWLSDPDNDASKLEAIGISVLNEDPSDDKDAGAGDITPAVERPAPEASSESESKE